VQPTAVEQLQEIVFLSAVELAVASRGSWLPRPAVTHDTHDIADSLANNHQVETTLSGEGTSGDHVVEDAGVNGDSQAAGDQTENLVDDLCSAVENLGRLCKTPFREST
jgi:hypothetical protein